MVARSDVVSQLQFLKNPDILIAIAMISIVMMMIIPVPPLMLDFFLAGNLAISVVVMMTVLYIEKTVDLSVFPALLLVTTVFRLSLNVSSTRMILLGRGEEITIIKAFGTFVVGGNYIVGVVIFLILVMIQFLVIVKGTTRVSEVAARFTLDAMPGKQMAIDADLNSGLINEQQAIARREDIRREADFYGAMDGATKFVQGDVMAGMVITAINIIGGLIIGVWMLGLSIGDSAKTFTLLTVGDGLVSQIPSLLISVSTGLIVTRAASEDNLGVDLARELTKYPRALMITSGTLGFLAFTPLPTMPLFIMAALTGFIGYTMSKVKEAKEGEVVDEKKKKEIEKVKKPESVISLLSVDPMELEIGYSLIPLVDAEQGGDLLERVTMIRRQCALDLGIVVPPIRIRDNMQLKPNVYDIKIRGNEVARGEIKPDHYLAMNPGMVTEEIEGETTVEPAFGLPAIWITESQRERADAAGYTVVDPPSIVATHVTEVIKRFAHEIISRQDTQVLIDNLKQNYPAVVEGLIPNIMTIGEVQKVLQNLLKDGISVRDLVTILETLADYGTKTKDIEILTKHVRMALSRQICNQYKSPDGSVSVVTLDPNLEEMLANSMTTIEEEGRIVVEPQMLSKIIDKLSQEMSKAVTVRYEFILLCSSRIRSAFKKLIGNALPNLIVLSYNEITSDTRIQTIGMISVEE
ncbi:MAG: flagellar biosynthesis protein FlhA [bacterium]|nr:flagellar biosynthesis protein FlhA [bacterium]